MALSLKSLTIKNLIEIIWGGSCSALSPLLVLNCWTGFVGHEGGNLSTPYFFTLKNLVSIVRLKALRSHHRGDQYDVFSGWEEEGRW
jgi:hypothetical protein